MNENKILLVLKLIVYDNQGLSDSNTYNVLIVEEIINYQLLTFQIQILQLMKIVF